MQKKPSSYNYMISYEPINDDTISPELEEQLDRAHFISLKGKQAGLKQLKKLIDEYPDVPKFKNCLRVWYHTRGNIKKAKEVNRQILQKHPDYFFAKIYLAHEYLKERQFEKVSELLGNEFEMKQLYPKRTVFHITEVVSLQKIALEYFRQIKDYIQAQDRLDQLKELNYLDNKELEDYQLVITYERTIFESPIFKNNNSLYQVKTLPQPITTKTEAPVFHHPEMERLYESSQFSQEGIDEFLALPKETLIQDLEAVLKDSIERFSFFEEEIDGSKLNFVLYALILLKELQAEESLPAITEILAQGDEYLYFYIGDFLTEVIWEFIFHLGKNHLDELSDFMKKPFIATHSKTSVSQAVAQFAIYYPEMRKEIIDWYSQIFQYYAHPDVKEGIIDDLVIGFMVCDVMDFCGKELKEEINILFAKNYIDETICGDWESVAISLDNAAESHNKNENFTEISELLSILGRSYNEDDQNNIDYEELYGNPSPIMPIQKEKELGRNDPCSCGSGKKHKKCCLNK